MVSLGLVLRSIVAAAPGVIVLGAIAFLIVVAACRHVAVELTLNRTEPVSLAWVGG